VAHLRSQFAGALSAIEPDDDDKANTPEAHQQVRAALESDPQLVEYGIDTILIGSYKRSVSIKRIKDVDVFGRMAEMPETVTSQEILDHVFNVLDKEFGNDDDGNPRCLRQDRSVQVDFPDFDLYVDAVPARPHGDGSTWDIPERGSDDEWVETNPDELTSLTSTMNDKHEGFYVKTVKLMRQTRRAQLGKAKPGGFFIEIATFHAFERGLATGTDQAEYYTSALAGVSSIIDDLVLNGVGLPDPTLDGQDISVRATNAEFEELRVAFATAAVTAAESLAQVQEGKAALGFRSLLGEDPDGEWVFPMPPGFNDDGTKKASALTPGDPTVPAGNRQFG
jgi:hypothetical protein